jgi:acetylornithine deacetylase/succinyl-diaminopimelate desuccinylase-like protein
VTTAAEWLRAELPSRSTVKILTIAGRTPVLLCDTGSSPDVELTPREESPIVFYGHLDVQPAGNGWTVTDPFTPVMHDDLLYGRGSSDDKFAPFVFAAIVRALSHAGVECPRMILLLETSEESSSRDFPEFLETYKSLFGEPVAFVCLDAFVPSNDTLWIASSMRGIIVADLTVAVGQFGLHSGLVGGVVPSSFRILRELLDRIEDSRTGEVISAALVSAIPETGVTVRADQATHGAPPSLTFATLPGVQPDVHTVDEQLARLGWTSAIAYVGIEGMSSLIDAGSVLRASTTLRLSIRTPPTLDASTAARKLAEELTSNPPQGAHVSFNVQAAQSGWLASPESRLRPALREASVASYGESSTFCSGGATIPALEMLSLRFPLAPVLPVGVATASSNPHGPDESLSVKAAVQLTHALAHFVMNVREQE